jgi:anhydro-N-acetylmuramic acid kinase
VAKLSLSNKTSIMNSGSNRERIFLGIMSGTSCDGLDLALVSFKHFEGSFDFNLIKTHCFDYDAHWRTRLKTCMALSAIELIQLEHQWSTWVADRINDFLIDQVKPECIGFHGHTVFHRPDEHFTYQMGDGALLAMHCGIDVVCDFRRQDVALGGQGAPLVPIGDLHLFKNYDAFLNLGGFANVSIRNGATISNAFDVCAVNSVLNYYASLLGFEFDDSGLNARSGDINYSLLEALNTMPVFSSGHKTSLGMEWVHRECLPLITVFFDEMLAQGMPNEASIKSVLATFCRHIAYKCAEALNVSKAVLVSGGGVCNVFLMECLKNACNAQLETEGSEITAFKEALIFAFLAYCRVEGYANTLTEATGAKEVCSAGAHYKVEICSKF